MEFPEMREIKLEKKVLDKNFLRKITSASKIISSCRTSKKTGNDSVFNGLLAILS